MTAFAMIYPLDIRGPMSYTTDLLAVPQKMNLHFKANIVLNVAAQGMFGGIDMEHRSEDEPRSINSQMARKSFRSFSLLIPEDKVWLFSLMGFGLRCVRSKFP